MNPTAIVHFCHPMNTCRATPMTSQSACFKVNMFVDSHNKNRFEHTIYSHLGMLPQLFISPGQSIDGQSHFAINRAKKKNQESFHISNCTYTYTLMFVAKLGIGVKNQ